MLSTKKSYWKLNMEYHRWKSLAYSMFPNRFLSYCNIVCLIMFPNGKHYVSNMFIALARQL